MSDASEASRSAHCAWKPPNEAWPAALAIISLSVFAFIAFYYRQQPLIELNAFRQTQTASTTYWMIRDGWRFPYETPIVGSPWAIPFEFPIYQSIVALIVRLTGFSLDAVGRMVSSAFLVGLAWPAFRISKALRLPIEVFLGFSALLWSNPYYGYWGRTFSIETAALFFTLAAVPYGIAMNAPRPTFKATLLCGLFATLGLLQKVTTAAPLLLFLACLILATNVRHMRWRTISGRQAMCWFLSFGAPLIICLVWVAYTDQIKAHHPVGSSLTSRGLIAWNFGTVAERLSSEQLRLIFWNRMIEKNGSGWLGLMFVAIALIGSSGRARQILVSLLVCFALPIFVFFGLHLHHEYYQAASLIYYLAAMALALFLSTRMIFGRYAYALSLTALVALNVYQFRATYLPEIRRPVGEMHGEARSHYEIGDIIRRYSAPQSAVVAFGADWNPTIAYYSQRKAMMVPNWFGQQSQDSKFLRVWNDPRSSVGGLKIGALVLCPGNPRPTFAEMMERAEARQGDRLFAVGGCFIWLPDAPETLLDQSRKVIERAVLYETVSSETPAGLTPAGTVACEGSIDTIGNSSGSQVVIATHTLIVEGWSVVDGKQAIVPDSNFITLTDQNGRVMFVATRKTPRGDVSTHYRRPDLGNVGFSTAFVVDQMHGTLELSIARAYRGRIELCSNIKKHIVLP